MKKQLLMTFLVAFSFCVNVFAQDRKVSGKVTAAEDGSGLPGVSVQVKGSNKGTTSDANGNYSIAVPDKGVLKFSFVGLLPKEVTLSNQSVIDVALAADARQLSEVVVTGTGSAISKKELAIDVQALKASELPSVSTASIDQALVGKIAGAQISSTNGMPGQPVNILLRGINTINRGTTPMILVDGVQLGATDLNSVDLNMIERVEVVQGAAAATIYGAQGANGVIQLFTKRGRAGKLNIDVSTSVTQSTYLNIGNVSKAKFHGFVTNSKNEVIGSSGTPLTLDPDLGSYAENLQYASTDPTVLVNKPYDQNLKYYDHFASFFVPATNQNHSLSISGGGEKGDFGFSLSRNKQESNFRNLGGIERTNLSANVGTQLAKGLNFRSTTQLVYTKNNINDASGRNQIYTIFNSRPFADYDFKDKDGNYPAYFGDAVGVNGSNPNYWNQYSSSNIDKIDIIQSLNLNYKFPKFVELDAKYGINYQNEQTNYTYLNQSTNVNSNDQQYWVYNYNDTDNTGEVNNYNYNKIFQNFIGSAFFKTDFQKDFNINLPIRTSTQVGFDWRSNNLTEYRTTGFTLPTYTPFNASQTLNNRIQRDYKEPFLTYGYLVNQRFDYGDIGGVSAGFRTDYSSAFGAGSAANTFPRGDAYLRLSSLNFWKSSSVSKILDEFKIRAAYGEAGIQPKPFDRYVTLGTRTIGSNGSFYFPLDQPNANLNVEISKELEIGTDLGLELAKGNWLSNASLSLSYWKRTTDNAIYKTDAAPSTGVGTLLDNSFSLASNGLQFSLNLGIYKSPSFKWDLTTNFGKQSSEITAVKGGGEVVVLSSAGSTNYVLKAGQKIGQLFGFFGIHSLDELTPEGTPALAESERSKYTVASNGWVVNKATKAPYFTAKQYSFGDPNPKFNMSFINNFSYKNFLTFGFQVDWVSGSHLYNQTKEWMYRDGIHADYAVPFSIDGQTGAWSAFYRGIYAERSRNGTKNYFYEDASFVRLRNVNVALDLAKVFDTKVFKRLQLVMSARNLVTLTNYTGLDPEISSGTNNSAFDRGTDHNTMPNLRSYQVGLNIGF
jgi:TonB-dependent starch-binding outer membrane protein SusC